LHHAPEELACDLRIEEKIPFIQSDNPKKIIREQSLTRRLNRQYKKYVRYVLSMNRVMNAPSIFLPRKAASFRQSCDCIAISNILKVQKAVMLLVTGWLSKSTESETARGKSIRARSVHHDVFE
jgi:hypothetical protein